VPARSDSIGAGIARFNAGWVSPLTSITSRRAYERSLVLLVKDLAGRDVSGQLTDPLATMTHETLTQHLAWRVGNGLRDPAELQRSAAHMTRLATWLDTHADTTIGLERGDLRARVSQLVAGSVEQEPA